MAEPSDEAGTDFLRRCLHPDLKQRVLDRYGAGFYDDAVFNAFKTVEQRLRDVLGEPHLDAMDLIKRGFNPSAGVLQGEGPSVWQSEREGVHLLFKGAFMAFRNPLGHRHLDLGSYQAVEMILLANRLLAIIEQEKHSLGPEVTFSGPGEIVGFSQGEYGPKVYVLDANGDGSPEVLLPSHEPGRNFEVFDNAEDPGPSAEVDLAPSSYGETLDIALTDVDGDGQQEIMCLGGWAAESGLLFYKYQSGRYQALGKNPGSLDRTDDPYWFFSARLVRGNDGSAEIWSEPWREVPPDLLPEDFEPGSYDMGRVSYSWRWNAAEGHFELLSRVLRYVGGR